MAPHINYYIFQELNDRLHLRIVSLMHRNSPSTWTKQIRTLANINQGNKTLLLYIFLALKQGFYIYHFTILAAPGVLQFSRKILMQKSGKTTKRKQPFIVSD